MTVSITASKKVRFHVTVTVRRHCQNLTAARIRNMPLSPSPSDILTVNGDSGVETRLNSQRSDAELSAVHAAELSIEFYAAVTLL